MIGFCLGSTQCAKSLCLGFTSFSARCVTASVCVPAASQSHSHLWCDSGNVNPGRRLHFKVPALPVTNCTLDKWAYWFCFICETEKNIYSMKLRWELNLWQYSVHVVHRAGLFDPVLPASPLTVHAWGPLSVFPQLNTYHGRYHTGVQLLALTESPRLGIPCLWISST